MSSKKRSVSTRMWSDPYIEKCSMEVKLLYLYLITNEKTNMIGVYEVSTRKIEFETGIDNVDNWIQKLQADKKILRIGEYVILKNFIKHQNYNKNMKISAIDDFNALPPEIKDPSIVLSRTNVDESFDQLSQWLILRGNGEAAKLDIPITPSPPAPSPDIEASNFKRWTFAKFSNSVINAFDSSGKPFDPDDISDFLNYWSEMNTSGTKMRFQLERTWNTVGRISTWMRNKKKWDKDPKPSKSTIDNASNELISKYEKEAHG